MKFNAAFWKWFGKSVMVDEQGDPLLMRHGSVADFHVFEKKFIRPDDLDAPFNGFWFTSDEWASPAMVNARFTKEVYLSIQNPAPHTAWRAASKEARKNTEKYEVLGARGDGDATRMILQERGYDGVIWSAKPKIDRAALGRGEAVSFLTARGRELELRPDHEYGGILLFDDGEMITGYMSLDSFLEQQEIVAVCFEPTQIKSVKNDGTWDAGDPDIRSNPPAISFKESVSQEWPLGTVRKLSNGSLQELHETPTRSIQYTKGNRIYAQSVEKWMSKIESGESIPPPDIRRYNGQHYIEDGHHRIEAAKQLKIKKIPMWLEY